MPSKRKSATSLQDAFAATVAKLEAAPATTANAVKTTPGHGVAGRHATRQLLDALSGNKDPGMFGRMFPMLAPLQVSDAKLQALADAMIDNNAGSPAGNNPNIPGGFTYFGQFVDHDITLDLTSLGDKEKDPLGIENFRTPERRSRLRLRSRSRRQPASLCAQSGRRQQARAEAPDRQESRHRRGRLPQRPAAQPRGLRADRRSSQRREPAGGADASRDAEVPQQGLRHAHQRRQAAGRDLRRGAPDRDLALSVDRAARLGRAAYREGHRREDPA